MQLLTSLPVSSFGRRFSFHLLESEIANDLKIEWVVCLFFQWDAGQSFWNNKNKGCSTLWVLSLIKCVITGSSCFAAFLSGWRKKGYKQISASLGFKLLILHGTSKIASGCGKWHGLFGLSVRAFPANAPFFLKQNGYGKSICLNFCLASYPWFLGYRFFFLQSF